MLAGGCARTPSGVSSNTTGDLLVTMTVAGQIRPADYYYVVFNTSNVTSPSGLDGGPCPVIAPGGNGFVSGAATQYVEYNGSLPGNGYEVYSFLPGTNLQSSTAIGIPTQDTAVTGSSISFRVPLSDLATAAIPVTSISAIQINFLTTDEVAVGTGETSYAGRHFDALGSTSSSGAGSVLGDYITISTAQGAVYSSANVPGGDTSANVQVCTSSGYQPDAANWDSAADQSLDIVGWSVQVEN